MTITCKNLSALMAGIALGALVAPAHAFAQGQQPRSPSAQAGDRTTPRRFSIPAGPLSAALNAWSRQSGRSIDFESDGLKGRRTPGVKGVMSSDAALETLLSGSGLLRYDSDDGSVALGVGNADNSNNATPDILVRGRRSWSLNTGVQRSQDDSQPFIVMSREEIQRSGAPNLESFLRDRLNVNASPGTSEQTKPGFGGRDPGVRGLSSINLRGLGSRDTLILVDGRRQPGVNVGNGTITQTSINNIPLAAIERIEVLASSASGIYGSGASGGVVNIVLKRDFSGGEVTATYSDTTDFAQGQGQIDITYGMPVEGGRTRLSATASWLKTNPLLMADRAEFIDGGIAAILANDPLALQGQFVSPPIGNTPNFKSSNGTPLRLKPQYGGTQLTRGFGSIPAGYRGVDIDGVTPLLAGIGTYNYARPDTATASGLRSPLLFGSERISGTLSARRTFNNWLTGYVGVTLSKADSTDIRARGPTFFELAADAPNNPFVQRLQVSLPGTGGEARVRSRQSGINLIGGVIARLPFSWQAALDLSYSKSRFENDKAPAIVSEATSRALRVGRLNGFRDVTANPVAFVYDDVPFYTYNSPGNSSTFAPSLRIAGPLPVTLPG
ncbi:MAG TPA: TonB-dependent receptor, partial [Sphingomonas sp.]|nr:TonB-dependent receptor [Sphingomonas sp.]